MKKHLLAIFALIFLFTGFSLFGENSHNICPEAQLQKVAISQRSMGKMTETLFEITIKNVSDKDTAYHIQIFSGKDATTTRFPVLEETSVKAGESKTETVSILKKDFPDKFTLTIEPAN